MTPDETASTDANQSIEDNAVDKLTSIPELQQTAITAQPDSELPAAEVAESLEGSESIETGEGQETVDPVTPDLIKSESPDPLDDVTSSVAEMVDSASGAAIAAVDSAFEAIRNVAEDLTDAIQSSDAVQADAGATETAETEVMAVDETATVEQTVPEQPLEPDRPVAILDPELIAAKSEMASEGAPVPAAAAAVIAEVESEQGESGSVPVAEAVSEPEPEVRAPIVVAQELPQGFLDTEGRIHQASGPHYRGRMLKIDVGADLNATVAKLQESFEELRKEAEELFAEAETAANKSSILGKVRRMKAAAGNADALGDFDALFTRLRATEAAALEQIKLRKETKESLIARAEALADSSSWKASGEAFRSLFDEWKLVGSAGRDADESTWKRFQAARDAFSKRRNEYFAERQTEWKANQEKKEALIQQATEIAESSDWRATSESMRTLMTDWKTIGSAGREHDDALWTKFRAAQQVFFDRRNAIGDEAKQKKEALILQAQQIVTAEDWENGGDQLKALMDEWRTIGPAGRRDVDDALWAQFRAAQDPFFEQRSSRRTNQKESTSRPSKDRKDAIAREAESLVYAPDAVAASEQIDLLIAEFAAIGPIESPRDATLARRLRAAAEQIKVAAVTEGTKRSGPWEDKIRAAMLRTRDDVASLRESVTRDRELMDDLKAEFKKVKGEARDLINQQIGDTEVRVNSSEAEIERLESTMVEIEASLRGED